LFKSSHRHDSYNISSFTCNTPRNLIIDVLINESNTHGPIRPIKGFESFEVQFYDPKLNQIIRLCLTSHYVKFWSFAEETELVAVNAQLTDRYLIRGLISIYDIKIII
jgi:hypothetical protein